MIPKDVLQFAKENECTMVDVKFQDFLGLWQHYTRPIQQLDEGSFEAGFGFDGSSIRGWQPIHASDMLVVPDPETARLDPFPHEKTLHLIGNIKDPSPASRTAATRATSPRRPRPT